MNQATRLYPLMLTIVFVSIALYVINSQVSYLHLFFLSKMPWQQESFMALRWTTFVSSLLLSLVGIGLFVAASFLASAAFFGWQTVSLPKILSAFVLGEILLSVFFLSLLVLTGLQPSQTAVVLALCALPVTLQPGLALRQSLAAAWQAPRLAWPRGWSLPWWLFFIFISALGFSSTRLSYDAVAYYFSQARLMAITGQAKLYSFSDAFVVSSLHPEILFAALIQIFGDQAARLLSWVNGAVILLAGWEIGKLVGLSKPARLYFLTLLLTSTAFVDLLGDGKVELISTAPIVVALWWMIDSLQHPSRRHFLLIGALLGFAIIARPYNIFLVPVFTILFYLFQTWPVLRAQGLKAALYFTRPLLWMFPTLLLMGAFHLWQNDLWLGSPLAPLTYARELDSGDWQWQFDPASLNILRLFYPLTVTFMNTPQSLGNISPLFVGFLPFLLFSGIRASIRFSESLRSLLLGALLTLILWITIFFTVVEIRYVFFLWIVFFLFGAQVIEETLQALPKGYQAILRAALTLLLSFILVRTLVISLATYSPIDANGQAHCYDIAFCTFLDPLNENAAEGERVFVLNAYRYYLRPDLFACSSQAQEYAPLQSLAKENDGTFWAELYRQGFQYLTYEKNFAEFHSHFGTIPPVESAPEWLNVEMISSDGNQRIYKLHVNSPHFSPLNTCTQTNNGIWQVTTKK
ncbi:MAG: hypothetical protein Fur0016_24640 [Anaerolineales bacterium]